MTPLRLVDFFVLSLLVRASCKTWMLLDEPKRVALNLNCYYPNVSPEDVAEATEIMIANRFVDVHPSEHQDGIPTRRLPLCAVPFQMHLELTAKGGDAWERIAKPNWHRVVDRDWADENDEELCYYFATTQLLLDQIPEKGSRERTTWLGPAEECGTWHPYYWKSLPNGFRRLARVQMNTKPIYTREEYEASHAQWVRECALARWIAFGFDSECFTQVDDATFAALEQ